MPSDPLAPITTPADADHLVNYLQEVVMSAMDKHTYQVPETNRRSQLPEEVLLAIRKQRELRRRWQCTQDPAVKRKMCIRDRS